MPYRMNIQEVVQETYSDLDKGLSEQEAAARLRDQGKNELLKKKKETVFQMFLEQFQDPMVIILIIGAIVSIFLKEYIDASIILTVIILNAIIGVVQEFKAEKAIDALESCLHRRLLLSERVFSRKSTPRSWLLAIWWSWKWGDTYRPICVWCHPSI